MTDARVKLAGGIWPVIDSREAPKGGGMTVWAYAADCSDAARAALAQEGVTAEMFATPEAQAGVYEAHGIESRAGMALGLWLSVHRARAMLSSASRPGGEALAESVAGAFIHLTQLRCVLDNMRPGGVASFVATGARAQSQRKDAAANAGAVSKRLDWHGEAERLWNLDPTASVTKVARQIAAKYGADQSSVMRSIRPLIPSTSASFRRE